MSAKHPSLNWSISAADKSVIMDEHGWVVCQTQKRVQSAEERAAFIVRCVKSHDELVAALENALKDELGVDWKTGARAALKKAGCV